MSAPLGRKNRFLWFVFGLAVSIIGMEEEPSSRERV
jgi:hypothetical protein